MKLTRFSGLAAALVAGSLVLSACGGSSDTGTDNSGSGGSSSAAAGDKVSGSLDGAGSTAQQAAMTAWAAKFQEQYPDATVNYDPVGSGGGREQFLAGGVLFAGSDAALSDEEITKAKTRCGGADALDLPIYVSPIAVAYNLPGVDSLQLSPDLIAKIFSGKIKKWDDPDIKAENSGAKLPGTSITPVHRSDESGTTQNFTDYLSKAAASSWTDEPSGVWPIKGGEAAQGTSGVVQAIKSGEGAIGYADESQVGDLGKAKVKVGSEYVEISAESAAKVAEISQLTPGRPAGDLAIDVARDTTESGAYPIILISYQIVCSQYDKASDAALVTAFETYVASAEGQDAASQAAGSAPISDALREKVNASIAMIQGTG